MSNPADRMILVLHEPGAHGGGADWDEAMRAAGWTGRVVAPDLPGHRGTPPPTGGHHELADAAFLGGEIVATLETDETHETHERTGIIALGVGANGWSAQLLVLGGRADALVLVDGLGAPWLDPATSVAVEGERLRAIAADPASLAAAPPEGNDPRLVHGVPAHGSRHLAERAAAATTVATLVIETARSAASHTDRVDLADRFAGPAQLVELDGRVDHQGVPAAAAALVVAWARAAAHGADRVD
ncbi:MAG: hypothetical protein JJE52_01080 [Acidimicrobiia bacterium]|nr:hypothetical protein [Acidimicrobiia bacterium]